MDQADLCLRAHGETPLVVVASPAWIERHGTPATLDDLAARDRLGFAYPRASGAWLQPVRDAPDRIRVSDGEGIRPLAGLAPARLAGFTIRGDVAAGRLVPLLPDLLGGATEAFHAVYVERSEALPQRVRVLLGHLGAHGMVH